MTRKPTNWSRRPQKNQFIFPAEMSTSADKGRHESAKSLNLSKANLISTSEIGMASMAKLTHKLGGTYKESVMMMHIAVIPNYKRACTNQIHSELILPGWRNTFEKKTLSNSRFKLKCLASYTLVSETCVSVLLLGVSSLHSSKCY